MRPETSASDLRRSDAFSLIEVVIAIGIASFALLSMFSLFSTSLKSNKDASAQQEGFEVERMITSYFQDTNFMTTSALSALMLNTFQKNRTNSYFIYTTTNGSGNPGGITTVLTNAPALTSINYSGTLYYVLISGSPNISASTFSGFAGVGATPLTSFPSWPSLPLHATVYAIPSTNSTNASSLSNSAPVISFDFVIPK
jgi:type II secretory pathway pseudopilin PulG